MVHTARKSSQKSKWKSKLRNRNPKPRQYYIDLSGSADEEDQLGDLFRSNSPTPTPTIVEENKLTPRDRDALEVLHQICAFEYLFMELFAILDGLNTPPVRSSRKVKFDRGELFVDPKTGILAKRNDDIGDLKEIIKRITQSQREYKSNIIPEAQLQRIERNFVSALHNTNLVLGISKEITGQVGLFVKSTLKDDDELPVPEVSPNRIRNEPIIHQPMPGALPPLDEVDDTVDPNGYYAPFDSTAKQIKKSADEIEYINLKENGNSNKNKKILNIRTSLEADIKGIRFELFSIPRIINDDIEKFGFNDDLTFDYVHGGKEFVLMGLGMARVINHHCEQNSIEWPFKPNGLKFDNEIKGIGYLQGKLVKKADMYPGMEVYGYYGDEFARLDCTCGSARHASQPTKNASPGPSTYQAIPQLQARLPIGAEPISRADSMDLGAVQMENPSPSPAFTAGQMRNDYYMLESPTYDDNHPGWRSSPNVVIKRKEQSEKVRRKRNKKRKLSESHEDNSTDDYLEVICDGDGDDDDDLVEYLNTVPSDEVEPRSSPIKKNKRVINSEEIDELEEEVEEAAPLNENNSCDPIPNTVNVAYDLNEHTESHTSNINESNTGEDNLTSTGTSSQLEIIDRLTQLDKRIEEHTNTLRNHENTLDDVIANLMELKSKIKRERGGIERCRIEQKMLIEDLKRNGETIENGNADADVGCNVNGIENGYTNTNVNADGKGKGKGKKKEADVEQGAETTNDQVSYPSLENLFSPDDENLEKDITPISSESCTSQ